MIFLVHTSLNAAWWSEEVINPLVTYKNNKQQVQSNTDSVIFLEGYVFAKTSMAITEIRHSKSWGILKMDAEKKVLDYYLSQHIQNFTQEEKLLYKTFFHFKSSGRLKGGMVVEKYTDDSMAYLVYGVFYKNIDLDLPDLDYVKGFLKEMTLKGRVSNPCLFRYLFNGEGIKTFDKQFICD